MRWTCVFRFLPRPHHPLVHSTMYACYRSLPRVRAYNQSIQPSFSRYCYRGYTSSQGLKRHWLNSPVHHYCEQCDRHFGDRTAHIEHNRKNHHYCEMCDSLFGSDNKLHRHHLQSHADRYCVECRRSFSSANNLDSASASTFFLDFHLIFGLLALGLQDPPGKRGRMLVMRQVFRHRFCPCTSS